MKYHKGIGGTHLGFEKNFIKLKERFYWPGMKEEAKLVCANCVRCGARKITTHELKGTFTSMAAGFPLSASPWTLSDRYQKQHEIINTCL